jgi:predicted TIM-barrel fold metal-dependent hydrolase
MIIDGFARANSKTVNAQNIRKHLADNNIGKMLMIPDYGLSKKDKPLPVKGEKKPHKDLLLPFFKKFGKSIKKNKISEQIRKGNHFLQQIHSELPDLIIPFAAADTSNPDASQYLDELSKKWNFKGLHIPNHIARNDLITPEMYSLFEWAQSNNLIVVINLNAENDLYTVQKVIRDFKNITFIIQHLVGFEKFAPCMVKNPNFWFDLSPMYAMSDYRILQAIELFGPRKLLYGTGFPYNSGNLKTDIQRLKTLIYKPNDLERITERNWEKILAG